jgi:hypothetical protein
MAALARLRDDYTADDMRGGQARERCRPDPGLLALAAISDGASRGEAGRIGGVGV